MNKKQLKKYLDYAMRENWEGMINWILEIAKREGISFNNQPPHKGN